MSSLTATMDNTIMLCACQENEDLPQLEELPADLFTACLTTPIKTALKWHWMKYNKYFPGEFASCDFPTSFTGSVRAHCRDVDAPWYVAEDSRSASTPS